MKRKCLLIHSFYNGSLSDTYVLNGKGLGFLSLFVLAMLTGLVYAVKVALFAAEITPAEIQAITAQVPQIEIQNGQIVEPKDFFGRIQLSDGVNVTLDTTQNAAILNSPSPNSIYISKDAVHFVNGNQVELMPLERFFGTQNLTVKPEEMHTFVKKMLDVMYAAIPLMVFVIAAPLVFFKYVVINYFIALLTYAMTIYPRVPLAFEQRMRLSALCTIPVFVINLVFGTALDWFTLGTLGGVIVVFAYLFYYLAQLPKEICVGVKESGE